MGRFEVELNDEPITVEVISYRPGADMIQTGIGDCIEPEGDAVEFHVVDDDVVDRLTDWDWRVLEDEVLQVMRQPDYCE